MFLHLSVILFTGRCLPLGQGGVHPWADTPQADTPWVDTPGQTYPLADTPPPVEMIIEAGGTHPAGMHSYLLFFISDL